MAFSDMVALWVKTNSFFSGKVQADGNDVYVPAGNKYPHVHIGNGFVVYSKSKNNHSYLVEGDNVYANRCQTARAGCGEAHIMQICRYIESQG